MRGSAVLLIGLILGSGAFLPVALAACRQTEAPLATKAVTLPGLRVVEGRDCMDRCMARCRAASGSSTQLQICARQCVVSCGR